jgi:hypothetical protein
MSHRVAIIGQSNSILLHGYATQLGRHAEVEIGHMGRLGASPSILLPFFGTPDFFAGHDFCIIDTAVMDQGFLWEGAVDPYSISLWLAAGIQAARVAGCQPILLFIPHQAAVPDPAGRPHVPFLQQLYRAVALHNGAICFDLTDYLAELARSSPRRFAAAYVDSNHLSRAKSKEVAERLVSLMDKARPRLLSRPAKPDLTFDRIAVAEHVDRGRRVARSSALLARDFAIIDADRPGIELPVGRANRVHGLLINRVRSGGRLAIEGAGRVIREIGTPPEPPLKLVGQLAVLQGRVGALGDVVSLTMAKPDEPVTETSWHEVPSDTFRAEISDLLVESDRRPVGGKGPHPPSDLICPTWESLG